jgi:hypothetical protein
MCFRKSAAQLALEASSPTKRVAVGTGFPRVFFCLPNPSKPFLFAEPGPVNSVVLNGPWLSRRSRPQPGNIFHFENGLEAAFRLNSSYGCSGQNDSAASPQSDAAESLSFTEAAQNDFIPIFEKFALLSSR